MTSDFKHIGTRVSEQKNQNVAQRNFIKPQNQNKRRRRRYWNQ